MSRDYQYYDNHIEIPYLVVLIIYLLAMVIMVVTKSVYCCWQYHKTNNCYEDDSVAGEGGCFKKYSCLFVRVALGTSAGITDDEDSDQSEVIYINKKPVSGVDTAILVTVILCYGLLISLSAYTVFILDVTHSCTQDGEISCFPRFVKDDDPENPNITEEEMSARIMDCSQWTNDSKIRFECFRFSHNGQAALTTIGGLYAVFTLAVRIAITVFLKVFQSLKWCCKKCCKDQKDKIVTGIQISCLVILLLTVGIGIFISLSFEINALFDMDMSWVDVFGFRFMIVMGTMTLMLLLSWSNYADDA